MGFHDLYSPARFRNYITCTGWPISPKQTESDETLQPEKECLVNGAAREVG